MLLNASSALQENTENAPPTHTPVTTKPYPEIPPDENVSELVSGLQRLARRLLQRQRVRYSSELPEAGSVYSSTCSPDIF